MFTVEAITDTEDFRELHERWNALAQTNATIFQSWEWAWCWWQANRRGKKLFIVTANENSELIGVMPLYLASRFYNLPINVISFLGTNGTDYLDILSKDKGLLGDVNNNSQIIEQMFNFLFENLDWDVIDLHQINERNPVIEIIKKKADSEELAYEQFEQDNCYSVVLPSTNDDFLTNLSKKFRWNLQYYERRLNRDYQLNFRLSNSNTVKNDIEIFFDLHKRRFLSLKKPGAYLSPSFRNMHLNIASKMADKGWLRLYFLELDNKPVASLYGFVLGESFYYYLSGFEPEWGNLSVSTVLIGKAIKDSIDSKLRYFDFLRGDEPYKLKWGAQKSRNFRILIYRKSSKKSNLVKKIMSIENQITKTAKDIVLNVR